MNCREYRNNLIELSRGGSLRAGGEQELRDHLDCCPECARLLERLQMLSGAMQNLAAQAAAILPPKNIEKKVLAELDTFDRSREAHEWNRQIGLGGSHGRLSRRRIPVIGGAVAASVLAGWLLIGRRASGPRVEYDHPSAVAAPGNTQPGASAIQPAVAAAIPAGAPERTVTRVVKRALPPQTTRPATAGGALSGTRAALPGAAPVVTAAAAATPDEPGQPFIAIPYTEPIAPYERASVMRMDLPVAAVVAAGLPLESRDVGERVRADVLVGEDGRARAIRLLYVSNPSIDRRQ